ncbi:uncharacterized protein LOC105433658 isoform X2 [Pogonomyrmex barbatus]|nr:uncharacterized protein LOC105433658 isoform X2 [Pogonomyrmex barbatus]
MESAVALKALCVTSLINKWMTSLSLRTSESGILATLRHFPSTDSQRTASTVFFGRVRIGEAMGPCSDLGFSDTLFSACNIDDGLLVMMLFDLICCSTWFIKLLLTSLHFFLLQEDHLGHLGQHLLEHGHR